MEGVGVKDWKRERKTEQNRRWGGSAKEELIRKENLQSPQVIKVNERSKKKDDRDF